MGTGILPGLLPPLWPRYDELTESVEEYVLDMLRDQLNRRQPIDNVSRNLLRLLTATCGYKEVRLLAVQRLEMWLQNPKVLRVHEGALLGDSGWLRLHAQWSPCS